MERNWLIRTSQNQILGPVAKQKLLEFIQKGALGMTDEVASGNGYWFSLKEKELVEKYLYGDVPQGYNPISESKSVLSKRENPEKTSSINTAPANAPAAKINLAPGIIPKDDDLAFPDMDDLTMVKAAPVLAAPAARAGEETKLPNQDDLAFPDMDMPAPKLDLGQDNQPFVYSNQAKAVETVKNNSHAGAASAVVATNQNNDEVALPAEDDLAFPDMDDYKTDDYKTSTKIEKGQVDLSHQYTRTVALDTDQVSGVLPEFSAKKPPQEIEDDFGDFSLALDMTDSKNSYTEEKEVEEEEEAKPLVIARKQPPEDKKLLHDRKPKNLSLNKAPSALRDPNRETAHSHVAAEPQKRNDNYLFFILIIIVMIIIAVFFYFKEILNKPLPV